MKNVAINGAGRIGALAFRRIIDHQIKGDSSIKLVLINDPFANPENILYRLKYDTTHGRFQHKIELVNNELVVADGLAKIKITAFKVPSEVPYKANNVEIVLECSGAFTSYEKAKDHLNGTGVKKVIISAPASGDEIKTLVYGVNEKEFDASKHDVLSNASCTTNCLAPVVKVLNDKYKLNWGYITTTHAVTATQKTVDGASSNFASGRCAMSNIIPASTGAAKAIGKVFPELNGKLDGYALRVPTINVSVTDFVFQLAKPAKDLEEVKKLFTDAANGPLKNILGIAHPSSVSSDFNGDSHSSIVQFDNLMVKEGGSIVKGLAFYDNEWGYSSRLIELAIFVANKI